MMKVDVEEHDLIKREDGSSSFGSQSTLVSKHPVIVGRTLYVPMLYVCLGRCCGITRVSIIYK